MGSEQAWSGQTPEPHSPEPSKPSTSGPSLLVVIFFSLQVIENFAQLQQELSNPEGFSSYQEIRPWLSSCQDLKVSYPTVHRITRYELGSKLKVPRPCHEKQKPGVMEVFKQHLQPED